MRNQLYIIHTETDGDADGRGFGGGATFPMEGMRALQSHRPWSLILGLGPVWGRVTEDWLLNGAEAMPQGQWEAIFKLRPTHWWSGPEIWQGWSRVKRVPESQPGGAKVGRNWWRVILQELLDVDLTERPQMQRAAMKTVSQRFSSCSLSLYKIVLFIKLCDLRNPPNWRKMKWLESSCIIHWCPVQKWRILQKSFTLELPTETLSVVLERVATLESDTPDRPYTLSCRVQCIFLWHTPFVKLMSVFLFVYRLCVLARSDRMYLWERSLIRPRSGGFNGRSPQQLFFQGPTAEIDSWPDHRARRRERGFQWWRYWKGATAFVFPLTWTLLPWSVSADIF